MPARQVYRCAHEAHNGGATIVSGTGVTRALLAPRVEILVSWRGVMATYETDPEAEGNWEGWGTAGDMDPSVLPPEQQPGEEE